MPLKHTVILAAGRGRRLAGDGGQKPKILLEFGGKSLLQRHLELLEQIAAGPVTVIVGYKSGAIVEALERLGRTHSVTLIENPYWEEGSAVSLDCAHDLLTSGSEILLMDADVLYDRRLLERLLASRHASTLLLDRDIEAGDEPVKICVAANGRIVDFSKRPEVPGDWHGESVGFFRFAPDTARELAEAVRRVVRSGARSTEYEEPIRELIRAEPLAGQFGFEDVTGLPWTEIDFMEDVAKAHALLPSLVA